jgi:hypothetical protein
MLVTEGAIRLNSGLLEDHPGTTVVNQSQESSFEGLEVDNPLHNWISRFGDLPARDDGYIAFQKGIPLFHAAGNDGHDGGISGGTGPYEFAVTALDHSGGSLAGYAEHGRGNMVEFVFDGTSPGGWEGTSFAAPKVAAGVTNLMDNGLDMFQAYTWLDMNVALYIDNPNSLGDYVEPDLGSTSQGEVEAIGVRETLDAAYTVGMGRKADGGGLDFWTRVADTHGLETTLGHMARTAAANGDDGKDEATVFERVQDHYHLFLGREPDEEGFNWWMERVARLEYGEQSIDWDQFTTDFISGIQGTSQFTDTMDPLLP